MTIKSVCDKEKPFLYIHMCVWTRPGSHLLVSDGVEAGHLDLVAVVMETHVTQHHDSAEQQSGWVRHVQTGDVGGGAVHLQKDHRQTDRQTEI